MRSSQIFNKFREDRYSLLRFYLLDMTAVLLLITVLRLVGYQGLPINEFGWVFIVPGILCGLVMGSFLHNSSHNNFKNKYLNRFVGEISGFWALYGYQNFVLIHILHHKFSDQEFDPVNPKGMNFIVFLTAPMRYMIKATKKYLISIHGHHAGYQQVMFCQSVVFNINLILKLVLWFVLLGPTLFLFFYLPGNLAMVGIFAHINYNCHQENPEDGTIEIVNLNHNLYYKFANMITSGGYFHKNHHLNPGLFDPRELRQKKATVNKEIAPLASQYNYL